MSGRKKELPRPSVEQLEKELKREKYRRRFSYSIKSTVCSVALFAAAVALLMTLFPVLRVQSAAMSPAMEQGDIVVVMRGGEASAGDVVAFGHGAKLMLRRVIALEGDVVNVSMTGKITVNGADTGYRRGNNAVGEWDVALPCTVPAGHVFVIGENRTNSADSGHAALGCIVTEQIAGRAAVCIWPPENIGLIQ